MSYFGLFPPRGRVPPPRANWRPGAVLPPGERMLLLLHGTTLPRAQAIAASQTLAPRRTFFALGFSNRDIARLFAARASQRSPREGPPALLATALPEPAFERLRRLGLLRSLPFDPGDRPELRHRRQWVLEPGGVELFNREAEFWRVIPLGPRR